MVLLAIALLWGLWFLGSVIRNRSKPARLGPDGYWEKDKADGLNSTAKVAIARAVQQSALTRDCLFLLKDGTPPSGGCQLTTAGTVLTPRTRRAMPTLMLQLGTAWPVGDYQSWPRIEPDQSAQVIPLVRLVQDEASEGIVKIGA